MRLLCLVTLCLCTPVALGAQQDSVSASDARAIRAARERSNRGIAAHDTAAIAAEWMPNFHVVTSNSVLTAGRDANALRFAEQFAARPDVVYRRTPQTLTVYRPWGMASEWGTWTGSWTDSDGAIRIGGTYFAKWQKLDGVWRIQAEIFVPGHCRGGAYCQTVPNVK